MQGIPQVFYALWPLALSSPWRLSWDEPARLEPSHGESASVDRRPHVIEGNMYGQHRHQYCSTSGLPALLCQHSDRPASPSDPEHYPNFSARSFRNICWDRRNKDIWNPLGASGSRWDYSHCRICTLFDRALWWGRQQTSGRSRPVGWAIATLSGLLSMWTGNVRARFEHGFLTAYQKIAMLTYPASICSRDRTTGSHGAVPTRTD